MCDVSNREDFQFVPNRAETATTSPTNFGVPGKMYEFCVPIHILGAFVCLTSA